MQNNWNINQDKWDDILPIVYNKNWRNVTFNYNRRDMIPQERGIYMVVISSSFLSKKEPFKLLQTPFYVGMSTTLKTRFASHTNTRIDYDNLLKRLGVFLRNSKFFYLILPQYTQENLKYIEQTLIDCFGCFGNKINSVSKEKIKTIKTKILEGVKHGE